MRLALEGVPAVAAFFDGVEGETFLLTVARSALRRTTFGGDRDFFAAGMMDDVCSRLALNSEAPVDSSSGALEEARPTPAVTSGKPEGFHL
jgi:hypothetical protein